MLNRRQLRVKVMQALYAWFLNKDGNFKKSEKELLLNLDKLYDLYLFLLLLLTEIADFAEDRIVQRKLRRLPTEHDLKPNARFIDNEFLKGLSENKEFIKLTENNKLNWAVHSGFMKQLFKQLSESAEYEKYMAFEKSNFEKDSGFIYSIYKKYIAHNELLYQVIENYGIYWAADFDLANYAVLKTIRLCESGDRKYPELLTKLKDKDPDDDFIACLYRKTIERSSEFEGMIGKKAKNWEPDRISTIDMILMKMALCEVLEFPTIPVKVTLNEYIEIAKHFSAAKSSVFINGILDKIVTDLKNENKIMKQGRGLIE